MVLKGIIDEDLVNYKKISMVLEFPNCSFKCDKESGSQICQNAALANVSSIHIDYGHIIERYLNNPITEAIVFQGLEPFDSSLDVTNLVYALRVLYDCHDDIVIYTGYTKEELETMPVLGGIVKEPILTKLKEYDNIIIKYGRFLPNQDSHYDEILGVDLASPNQYAEKLC